MVPDGADDVVDVVDVVLVVVVDLVVVVGAGAEVVGDEIGEPSELYVQAVGGQ